MSIKFDQINRYLKLKVFKLKEMNELDKYINVKDIRNIILEYSALEYPLKMYKELYKSSYKHHFRKGGVHRLFASEIQKKYQLQNIHEMITINGVSRCFLEYIHNTYNTCKICKRNNRKRVHT